MASKGHHPKVVVLMATFNGAPFVAAQLRSIYEQTLRPKLIIVSDDHSSDETRQIIEKETQSWSECEVRILTGPGRSASENFTSLLQSIPDEEVYVALSDQDDVWLPTRIETSVHALKNEPENAPALFGSATWICDQDLKRLSASRKFSGTPTFKHALAQNFAGGNTMTLNPAAVRLVQRTQQNVPADVVHDWWLYLLVSGAGGSVIYSDEPTLLYRQHASNVIGSNQGFFAAFARARRMLSGQYQIWNDANLKGLLANSHELTAENRDLVANLVRLRKAPLATRLRGIWKLGVVRYGVIGRIGLWGSVLLNRF